MNKRSCTALLVREDPNLDRFRLRLHDIVVISKLEDTRGYRFNTVLITNNARIRNKDFNKILRIIEESNEEGLKIIEL